MNLKEFFYNLLFAFSLVYLGYSVYSYFFKPKSQDVEKIIKGEQFVAPKSLKSTIYPIDFDINFSDKESSLNKKITQVETQDAIWNFSNIGGAIDSISYKRNINNKMTLLDAVPEAKSNQDLMLLLAFADNVLTPLDYTLKNTIKNQDKTTLVYAASNDQLEIVKNLTVYETGYKVDLSFSVTSKFENLILDPKILFNSPILTLTGKADKISTILYSNGSLVRKNGEQVSNLCWLNPEVFGTQDLYFTNILVKDSSEFVLRGCYKADSQDSRLISILQGLKTNKSCSGDLTFYFGPKEINNLESVDPKLSELLDYGWLGFVSKPLLKILNIFKDYLGSYGWAIILFSLLLSMFSIPFVVYSERRGRGAAQMQKKIEYLESNKNAKNEEELARLKLEHMKMSSIASFPKILPLFIIIALTNVIRSSLDLYKASFLWISDLAGSDSLFILPILFWIIFAISVFNPKEFKKTLLLMVVGVALAAFLNSILCAGALLFIMTNTLGNIFQPRIVKIFSN